MKTVAYFSTLMMLARTEANARLNGSNEEYLEAKRQHEAYRQICINADEVITGRVGDMS
jgi:hypothetical protein